MIRPRLVTDHLFWPSRSNPDFCGYWLEPSRQGRPDAGWFSFQNACGARYGSHTQPDTTGDQQ